jgi:plasmid maintenance system antidote protein VapI
MAKKLQQLDPIHPGEILAEEFMKPLGHSCPKQRRS